MSALDGIRVLDFSTLVPGPLAGLMLAEAGADVIKVERPGTGDDMRGYEPRVGGTGIGFSLLNRGKRSLALDLRDPDVIRWLLSFAAEVDIVIEQFRPGVMDRLELGYQAFCAVNPRIIYCSITGYGQEGPKHHVAGHDLSYLADVGLLDLSAGPDGTPSLPPTLIADIGAGSFPAVVNILLALRTRDRTGEGCRLDISMTDNLFVFAFWALAAGLGTGRWPVRGRELLTGGSPRYRVYRTADGHFVAVAALEDKFWHAFCQLIALPVELRDEARAPAATIAGVAQKIAARPAAFWTEAFRDKDVCCSVVRTLDEALADPHFRQRGLFDDQIVTPSGTLPALPVSIAPAFRRKLPAAAAPVAGQDNELIRPQT
ncbi:MAG: CaiB/BaiF CoA transferase family protein [Alphaproteobacteria bacterium]